MFTGIVEHLGSVAQAQTGSGGMQIVVDVGPLEGMAVGDSIAVNGVCLTAVEAGSGRVRVDVVEETLRRTTLGELRPGDLVNLERPLSADGRFDGHIVQGHVDGVGDVTRVVEEGQGRRMTLAVPPQLMRYLVEKGSVTVDGVSLTVATLTAEGFELALIPHTSAVTTLGLRKAGDKVNLEVDVLAKYVERLLGET
jgi:riboflavin synthase